MLFACSSSTRTGKIQIRGKMQGDARARFESVTEISRLRDKARGSNFSTRKTGRSADWLSSESLLETRVCSGHLQAASDTAQECVQDIAPLSPAPTVFRQLQ